MLKKMPAYPMPTETSKIAAAPRRDYFSQGISPFVPFISRSPAA